MAHKRPTPAANTDGSMLEELLPSIRGLEARLNPPKDHTLENPAEWIRTRLGEHLWTKQRIIAKSVQRHRFTTVRSCHSIGKSYLASRLVAWWICTKPDPFVVTTAPSGHQVRSILWREIKRAHKAGNLKGRITEGQVPEWKVGNELVAFGRKPADYVDPNEAATAFQGIHALNLLVVLDEASGIPEWLANAVETLVANDQSRVLAIGNPDNPTSWFAKTHRPGSGYHVIKISAFDTPAYTHEEIPKNLQDLLVSKTWVEERQKRWGTLNPLYTSKVEAEFPELTDDTVFTPYHINIAGNIDRRLPTSTQPAYAGFDVARYGPDECCVYVNQSGHVRHRQSWGKTDTMETVGRFRRLFTDRTPPHTAIDVNGVGGGVYDRLKELKYPVTPFNGGERAHNPQKYANRRAEAFWEAREAIELGLIDLDPKDEDLAAELLEIQYKINSHGQIQIEPKDDIKLRLGRSPNRADAFAMSLQRSADWIRIFAPETLSPNTTATPSSVPPPFSSNNPAIFIPLNADTAADIIDGEIYNYPMPDLTEIPL